MSVLDIIESTLECGVKLFVEDGKLGFRQSKDGRFSEELKSEIKLHRKEIIDFLSRQEMGPSIEQVVIKPRSNEKREAPLSFSQERIFFIDRLQGGSVEYNKPAAFDIAGALSIDTVEKVFTEIIQRHEILRTVYHETPGGARQRVLEEFSFDVEVHDLSELPDIIRQEKCAQIIRADAVARFDLSSDLMVRSGYVVTERNGSAASRGTLYLNMHHIACDGWSMEILTKEFFQLYDVFTRKEASVYESLKLQYLDYSLWLHSDEVQRKLELQFRYWMSHLNDAPSQHSLPLLGSRPKNSQNRGMAVDGELDASVAHRLVKLARHYQMTPFMMLHSALGIVLGRHSGSHDIVLGTPIANRSHPQLKKMIGFLVNTLVLRVNTRQESIHSYLEHVRRIHLTAHENQWAPFEQLVERLGVPRVAGCSPLVQIMLTTDTEYSLNTVQDKQSFKLAGVEFTPRGSEDIAAKFDLVLNANVTKAGVNLRWIYDVSLFDHHYIEQLNDHLCILLTEMAALSEHADLTRMPMSQLRMLSEREQRAILSDQVSVESPNGATDYLHDLFDEQVKRNPSKAACRIDDAELSYEELNRKACQLAVYLTQHQELQPGQLVGIFIDRSLEAMVAILGVLKAGGAYLPLDPEYPSSRLDYIIEDSRVELILTKRHLSTDTVVSNKNTLAIDIDPVARTFNDAQIEGQAIQRSYPLMLEPPGSALAYVIYTSGSTGKPKGVMCHHLGAANLFRNQSSAFHVVSESRVLQFASFSFDAALSEWVMALLSGATLVIATSGQREDPSLLSDVLLAERITHVTLPPSLLGALPFRDDYCLNALIVAGESPDYATLQPWCKHYAVFNAYGPTESSVCVSYARVTASQKITIGRPLDNIYCLVLDENQALVPSGGVGELCIGGMGLARGYLNNQPLTDERFVANPYLPESTVGEKRIYRSGDLVRHLDSGDLEFIGRIDEQITLRGYRIEPGEIEHCLTEHPQIASSMVMVKRYGDADERLVAYVQPADSVLGSPDESLDTFELVQAWKRYAQEFLPLYMVPSSFVIVPSWPMTANGKVDKDKLGQMEEVRSTEPFVPPETKHEVMIAAIWSGLLGVDQRSLSTRSHFFELGGHSLLAAKMTSLIREQYKLELPLRLLFEYPVLADLARALEQAHAITDGDVSAIVPLTDVDQIPLSHSQQRLWFIDLLEEGSAHYNMVDAYTLEGDFSVEAMASSLATVIDRHHVLRTSFRQVDGFAVQVVSHNYELPLQVTDWSDLDDEQKREKVLKCWSKEANFEFDLSRDLMIRLSVLVLDAKTHVLILNMHHIASDGWSMGILIDELTESYNAFIEQREPGLRPLDVQYVDYAVWQRRWLETGVASKQLDYWRKQLSGLPALHNLPLKATRSREQDFAGRRHVEIIGSEQFNQLKSFCTSQSVTLYMVLQTTLSLIIGRFSNEEDVVIGSPISGRVRKEIEPLIGFFLNTLVLRCQLDDDLTFAQLLERNKKVILDAYTNQHVPFEMIVEDIAPDRNLGYNPVVQILLNVFESVTNTDVSFQGLDVRRLEDENTRSISLPKADIIIYVRPRGDELSICWDYRTSLFSKQLIQQMSGSFCNVLEQVLVTPSVLLTEIDLFSPSERKRIQRDYYPVKSVKHTIGLVHEAISRLAESQPDETALLHEFTALNFLELEQRSDVLAKALVGQGVRVGDVVGVYCQRGIPMAVAVVAILKAGAVFAPIVAELPARRVEYMIRDSRMVLLLTDSTLQPLVPVKIPTFLVDSPESLESRSFANVVLPQVTPADASYLIYTSGSTGRPKGVLGTHAGLANRMAWMHREFPYDQEEEVACHITSIGFIRALWELLCPLSAGVKVVIVNEEDVTNAFRLVDLVALHSITRLVTAPSLASAITSLDENQRLGLQELRYWFISGEPVKTAVINRLAECFPDTTFCNLYGSTEVVSDVTSFTVQSALDRNVPIGKAIDNSLVMVLDHQQRVLPVGVVGEICVAGDSVSRGYVNHPVLTDSKFVEHGFAPYASTKLYRTGDLGVLLESGDIECLGRKDKQVKIRGYRIELEEIERLLSEYDAIDRAIVLVTSLHQGDDDDGEDSGALVAFVVPSKDYLASDIDHRDLGSQLIGYLSEHLPSFMIPARFVALSEFPLLLNGKIDRAQLVKTIHVKEPETELSSASTATERTLVDIWQNLLNRQDLGTSHNFFDYGGHSLLVIRMISQIRRAFDVEVTPRMVFELPTAAELSVLIDAKKGQHVLPLVTAVSGDRTIPLSFSQQRLWFLYELQGSNAEYNMPSAFRLTGNIHLDKLQQALNFIVERHSILRTVYRNGSQGAYQYVRNDLSLVLNIIELSAEQDVQSSSVLHRIIQQEAKEPFDLRKDLLLRAAFIGAKRAGQSTDDTADSGVLILTMHHIASDGWSREILITELMQRYTELVRGEPSAIEPLSVQYQDFAQWQRRWLTRDVLNEQYAFWAEHLKGAPIEHDLRLDRERPKHKKYAGESVKGRLSGIVCTRLQHLVDTARLTPFMLFHAALARVLSQHSGSTDIVIGTPVANRRQVELEALIGFFVNSLVLRVNTDHKDLGAYLSHVRQINVEAQSNQDMPFEQLVERLNVPRSTAHTPLFQVVLTTSGDFGQGDNQVQLVNHLGIDIEQLNIGKPAAKYDLQLHVESNSEAINLLWIYDQSIFSEDHVSRINGHLCNVLSHWASVGDNLADPQFLATSMLDPDEASRLIDQLGRAQSEYCLERVSSELWQAPDEAIADTAVVTDSAESLRCFVLDQRRELTPLGAVGELFVSSGNEFDLDSDACELTGDWAAWVKQQPSLRSSGDLVYYGDDGKLVFVGRKADALTIGGVRVNMKDIESLVREQEGVSDAYVTPIPNHEDPSGEPVLVAYLIATDATSMDLNQVDAGLRQILPDYKVPAYYQPVSAFPLDDKGQVDADRLPVPVHASMPEQYVEPQSRTEHVLVSVWSELLDVEHDQLSVTDNFFKLGGHSFLIMKMIHSLTGQGLSVTVKDVYDHPGIRSLAQHIDRTADVDTNADTIENVVPLNHSHSVRTVFAVHPFGGNVIKYKDLAGELQAVSTLFGLECPDISHVDDHDVIRYLTDYHVSNIRTCQPEGPYRLIGWSSGGKLCYEISRRLSEAGERVALTAILDTTPNHEASDLTRSTEQDWFDPVRQVIGNDVDVEWESLRGTDQQDGVQILAEEIIRQSLVVSETKDSVCRYLNYLCKMDRAFEHYHTSNSDIDLTLFVAPSDVSSRDVLKLKAKDDYGWSEFTSGNIIVHQVEGQHATMLNQEYLGKLIHELTRCLVEGA